MVQLDKVQGQKGHMIIQEDGVITASSGELASSETTSQQVTGLMAHSLPVDFDAVPWGNGDGGQQVTVTTQEDPDSTFTQNHGVHSNGASGDSASKVWKWNRITVSFGDHSYVACLSNRRIHVVKREREEPQPKDENLA